MISALAHIHATVVAFELMYFSTLVVGICLTVIDPVLLVFGYTFMFPVMVLGHWFSSVSHRHC